MIGGAREAAGFCIEALQKALIRYGAPEIFNTDQGSQFTTPRFTEVLEKRQIRISMDGRGRWLDNVFIERLWRSLKYECVYLHAFETGSVLRIGLAGWIADYNRKRPHSALAGRTPDEAYHDVADTDLRSPVSGIVQQLSVHSVRGVVAAEDRLLVVVPDDRGLDVETETSNRDIGFVREGQQVQVKVAAFKFTRYGLVPGHVVSISRTSIADDLKTVDALNDPDGHGRAGKTTGAGTETDLDGGEGSGYVAQIALDRQNIETEAGNAQLRAGMAVTAGTVTGRRHVISYILSPVQRYAHNAGRER